MGCSKLEPHSDDLMSQVHSNVVAVSLGAGHCAFYRKKQQALRPGLRLCNLAVYASPVALAHLATPRFLWAHGGVFRLWPRWFRHWLRRSRRRLVKHRLRPPRHALLPVWMAVHAVFCCRLPMRNQFSTRSASTRTSAPTCWRCWIARRAFRRLRFRSPHWSRRARF